MRKHARIAALISLAIGVSATFIGTAPTHAASSPDDGAIVATQTHVDAPKAYWENGTFSLKSHINSDVVPLEDTVNWVGKGYGLTTGRQQYQLITTHDPVLEPLREHGDRWYLAPRLIDGPNPIWAGYGADLDIPTERFRDAIFTLDIVRFNGPGRMELMIYHEESGIRRLLSSHENGLHSAYLAPGRHTHNETVFTKPGRYEVTYRVTARDKDTGEVIASQETPHIWQIGGARPEDDSSTPLAVRFGQANDSTPTNPYTFTITNHNGRDRDGDDQLTDFIFDAGDNTVTGTLAISIDGYHLTEIPVTGGQAVWSEMIGSGRSNYQAVFIPSDDSTAPRWASTQIAYAFGDPEATTTSDDGMADTLASENSDDPAPTYTTSTYTPASYDATVTSEAISDTHFTSTLRLADPNVRGYVTGGYYEDPSDSSPMCAIQGTLKDDGTISSTMERRDCEGYHLRLHITPHPLMNAQESIIEGTETLDTSKKQVTHGSLKSWPSSQNPDPAPDTPDTPEKPQNPPPSPQPSPDPSPENPGESTDKPVLTEPVVLTKGHVDIAARYVNNQLQAVIRDDTLQHAQTSVDRTPSSVALALDNSTLHARPKTGILSRPEANFLPEKFYYVDAAGDSRHIWPGWSTTSLDATKVSSPVLSLAPRSIPEGGAYHLFTANGINGNLVHLIDSSAKKTTIDVPTGTHAHASWAFTRPGVYLMDVSYSATVDGKKTQSQPTCMTFLVGKKAIADYAANKTVTCQSTENSSGNTRSPEIPKIPDFVPPASKNPAPPTQGRTPEAHTNTPNSTTHNNGQGDSQGRAAPVAATKEPVRVCRMTTKTGGSYTVPANTHVHPNWVFTKEGDYKVTITQSTTLKDGTKVSAPMTLNFTVGGSGNANSGHYDLGASIKDKALVPVVKDPNEQWKNDPSSLVFGLGEQSKATAPEGLEFIAEKGAPIWMISSTQVNDVPWIGVNTMHPSVVSETTGEVTWTLDAVEGPGALAVFTSGNLGSVVGTQWFGGATEKCGYVDENGNPVSGPLARTGSESTQLLILGATLLAAGFCVLSVRRNNLR